VAVILRTTPSIAPEIVVAGLGGGVGVMAIIIVHLLLMIVIAYGKVE
jgi:hypothetical protein